MLARTLPLLIERAQLARDRQAALARQAQDAARMALSTLDRLEQFRGDCIARSPAQPGLSPDAQMLGDYQRFVGRLDDAIVQQHHESVRRQQRSDAGREALLETQRRVMAFETLARRREGLLAKKENRRNQRDSDEFAARAVRRTMQEKLQ